MLKEKKEKMLTTRIIKAKRTQSKIKALGVIFGILEGKEIFPEA